MRMSDWSSYVCSSDLPLHKAGVKRIAPLHRVEHHRGKVGRRAAVPRAIGVEQPDAEAAAHQMPCGPGAERAGADHRDVDMVFGRLRVLAPARPPRLGRVLPLWFRLRSEEHTSELQS